MKHKITQVLDNIIIIVIIIIIIITTTTTSRRQGCKQDKLCRVVNVQTWLELGTSLQIMFKLELVKYKNLSLTWLGLMHYSSQA